MYGALIDRNASEGKIKHTHTHRERHSHHVMLACIYNSVFLPMRAKNPQWICVLLDTGCRELNDASGTSMWSYFHSYKYLYISWREVNRKAVEKTKPTAKQRITQTYLHLCMPIYNYQCLFIRLNLNALIWIGETYKTQTE